MTFLKSLLDQVRYIYVLYRSAYFSVWVYSVCLTSEVLSVYRNLTVYNCLMTHLSVYFFEYMFVYVYVCLKHLAYHVTADISPLELPTDNDTKSWNIIDSANSVYSDQTGSNEQSDLGPHICYSNINTDTSPHAQISLFKFFLYLPYLVSYLVSEPKYFR